MNATETYTAVPTVETIGKEKIMNASVESQAEYLNRCKLATDAAAASAAARAAWKKLRTLERRASELYAEAMRAYEGSDEATLAAGLKKASRKHWHASYVAEAGFQRVYEAR